MPCERKAAASPRAHSECIESTIASTPEADGKTKNDDFREMLLLSACAVIRLFDCVSHLGEKWTAEQMWGYHVRRVQLWVVCSVGSYECSTN